MLDRHADSGAERVPNDGERQVGVVHAQRVERGTRITSAELDIVAGIRSELKVEAHGIDVAAGS